MAYDAINLSALTYANGFTQWHYKTSDPLADVTTVGYFNDARSMLRPGDEMVINARVNDDQGGREHGRRFVFVVDERNVSLIKGE